MLALTSTMQETEGEVQNYLNTGKVETGLQQNCFLCHVLLIKDTYIHKFAFCKLHFS